MMSLSSFHDVGFLEARRVSSKARLGLWVLCAAAVLGTVSCASFGQPRISGQGSSDWSAVLGLEAGDRVVVGYRDDPALRLLRRVGRGNDPEPFRILGEPRVAGRLLSSDESSIEVLTDEAAAISVVVPYPVVVTVDVVEVGPEDPRTNGVLIGAAAGLGVAAAAGLFSADDLVFSGKVVYASGFAAGGALIGLLIDGHTTAATHRRVYDARTVATRRPRR